MLKLWVTSRLGPLLTSAVKSCRDRRSEHVLPLKSLLADGPDRGDHEEGRRESCRRIEDQGWQDNTLMR